MMFFWRVIDGDNTCTGSLASCSPASRGVSTMSSKRERRGPKPRTAHLTHHLAVARGRDSTQSSWGRFQRHAAQSAPGFGRNCASTIVLLVLGVDVDASCVVSTLCVHRTGISSSSTGHMNPPPRCRCVVINASQLPVVSRCMSVGSSTARPWDLAAAQRWNYSPL